MRRTFAVAVVLVAGLALTAPASAATPTEKRLTRQVTALQKQVKKLQRDLKQMQGVVGGALAIQVCSTAITADALHSTWAAVNAREASQARPPVFATESAVNDAGACTAAKVTRAPAANPPNLTPFKALLAIFASFF